MAPSILSSSFWRAKWQSLKSSPRTLIGSSSEKLVSTQLISTNLVARSVVSTQVVSQTPTMTTYVVQSGDTFASIASKLGTTVNVIELANPGDSPSSLQVGEVLQLQVPSSSSTYTIQAGDTLNAISTRFGTTVAALEAANPTVNPSNLQVGAQIIIPATATPAPAVTQPSTTPAVVTPSSNATYTIQSGDTFNSIATKLGITVAVLEAANPTVNINNLQVGAQISIPSTTSVSVPQPITPAPATVVPSTVSGSNYTVQAGDTFFSIATEFGTTVVALQAANPIAEGAGLTVGSQITIPTSSTSIAATPTPAAQVPVPTPASSIPVTPAISAPATVPTPTPAPSVPSTGSYTIRSGDTFTLIASEYGISVATLEAANSGTSPTALQVGQVITIPSVNGQIPNFTPISTPTVVTPAPVVVPVPVVVTIPTPVQQTPAPATIPATPAATPSSGTYTIQASDTLVSIASKYSTTLALLEAANPTIVPNILSVGETINLPVGAVAPAGPTSSTGGAFVNYSGPAANYPDPSTWAPYAALWAQNSALMAFSDSPSEIALIGSSIQTVATESGIDPRVILCIIMQESGGNVNVGNTFNGVINTGIMQAFDGASFDPSNPAGSILQMIRDGAEGTANGPGLKQAYAEYGNWYDAARKYNSGSVDLAQLNDALGATATYVVDFANRLMGNVWANM